MPPNLKQRFVQLHDLLLEDLRSRLLCEGRGLHIEMQWWWAADAWSRWITIVVGRTNERTKGRLARREAEKGRASRGDNSARGRDEAK